MEINIIEDKYNSLLNRHEVDFNVSFEGPTPSRNDIRAKLSAMLNKPLELLIIQKVDNYFGKQEAKGYAKIYDDEQNMKKLENEYVLSRNVIPEVEETEQGAGEKASVE